MNLSRPAGIERIDPKPVLERRFALKGYRLAIIGATGAVGRELLALIEERSFPCTVLRLAASRRSAGRTVKALGRRSTTDDLATSHPAGVDAAFSSAGAERARRFGPVFAEAGAWVIDNSSAFRRDPSIPLIVPEVNGAVLEQCGRGLIANPNCSTIIALLPLAALEGAFGIERVLAATYQAVSGAGGAALEELDGQAACLAESLPLEARVLPKPILHNLIPWIGKEDASGFCEEERKMTFESRKILGRPDLKISATTVRVPVRRCHSMAVWVRLKRPCDKGGIQSALARAAGIALEETPPCPAEVEGTDAVHVGRVRMDPDDPGACWFWAVSDQLRKGAALNAVQIAERLHAAGRIT